MCVVSLFIHSIIFSLLSITQSRTSNWLTLEVNQLGNPGWPIYPPPHLSIIHVHESWQLLPHQLFSSCSLFTRFRRGTHGLFLQEAKPSVQTEGKVTHGKIKNYIHDSLFRVFIFLIVHLDCIVSCLSSVLSILCNDSIMLRSLFYRLLLFASFLKFLMNIAWMFPLCRDWFLLN